MASGEASRQSAAEAAEPKTPLFTRQALAAAIAQQDFGQPDPSSAPPTGVLDFDAKDFEWGPYAQRIYLIIKRNWFSLLRTQQMAPGMRGRTRLNFRIQRDGQVLQLQILDRSEWEILDRAAQGSVELSDPLPPLPEEYPRQDVGVTFTYYYNMPMER
jgi:TonB family protein